MNDIPKVNEKRNADKKFCRENKKIAEQERLLGYYYISQKFLSVDVWFGLCENSHNAKAKNREYKNIVKFFKLTDQMPKSVYVRGRDIFYGNFVKNEPNGKKVSDYIVEALK